MEQKVPTSSATGLEVMEKMADNIRLAVPPHPILLMGTMEKHAAVLSNPQSAFHLQVARAGLRLGVAPTMEGVHEFAQVLLAKHETMSHGGNHFPVTTKVKAMDAMNKPGLEGRQGS